MIKIDQFSQQAGFGMPVSWRDVVSAAAVPTFPTMGGVSAKAAVVGAKRLADVAPVCTYTHNAEVFVLEGASPGTPTWSPPT